LSQRICLSRG
jgi:LysM repeat protein